MQTPHAEKFNGRREWNTISHYRESTARPVHQPMV
jgi:hypothetical protein